MNLPNYKVPDLGYLSLAIGHAHYQLHRDELTQMIVGSGEGKIADSGAPVIETGKFTGRSPKDRFIVKDKITGDRVFWSDVNIAMSEKHFDRLYGSMMHYMAGRTLFVRDSSLGANRAYQLNVRTIVESAGQDLFVSNLFIQPEKNFPVKPEWTLISAPGFHADPETDGTRQGNFTVISFSRRLVLIGGSAYTGEIKKAMFSVLNFLLPFRDVLPMHCAANSDTAGNTALFFGLSGTGKTTLSADMARKLIGDDEHGWAREGIFNFEGGCYAKTAGLTPEKEPAIYNAIRKGALLENVSFYTETNRVNFNNLTITENTRVSYPLSHLEAVARPATGKEPAVIFFLTADATGVLPPMARLNRNQAMYYFLSGYTSKIAGTEDGITTPQPTFSSCFGKAFLPLNPVRYAELLGGKLDSGNAEIWMINTGWTGGAYGIGERIPLQYTRAMVNAVLNGDMKHSDFISHPVFGVSIPMDCPDVPANLLNPATTWPDPVAYDDAACRLSRIFKKNFVQYEAFIDPAIVNAGPLAMDLCVETP